MGVQPPVLKISNFNYPAVHSSNIKMKTLLVKCPNCGKKHDYYQSKPWSPFCSERCKLIDLGAWASEEHRIKGPPLPASENDVSGHDGYSDQDNKFIN